jgi:hypothetical protein
MYNKGSGVRMIAASARRNPWLSTLLAILLAAPGLPISAAPGRDSASVGIHGPRTVRADARDSTTVSVSLRGRDNQVFKSWVVTLILVPVPGGPGLVNDRREEKVKVPVDADNVARFPGLRANGILGSFSLIARAEGPDGQVVDAHKTVRNVKGFVLFGLSVKQLVGIAGGAAVATGLGLGLGRGSSPPPTTISLSGTSVTTGRKPRR